MTIVWSSNIVRIDCKFDEILGESNRLMKTVGVLYSAGILKLSLIQILYSIFESKDSPIIARGVQFQGRKIVNKWYGILKFGEISVIQETLNSQ